MNDIERSIIQGKVAAYNWNNGGKEAVKVKCLKLLLEEIQRLKKVNDK